MHWFTTLNIHMYVSEKSSEARHMTSYELNKSLKNQICVLEIFVWSYKAFFIALCIRMRTQHYLRWLYEQLMHLKKYPNKLEEQFSFSCFYQLCHVWFCTLHLRCQWVVWHQSINQSTSWKPALIENLQNRKVSLRKWRYVWHHQIDVCYDHLLRTPKYSLRPFTILKKYATYASELQILHLNK